MVVELASERTAGDTLVGVAAPADRVRRVGSLLAIVGASIGVLGVVVRMLIASFAYWAWVSDVKFPPTGDFQGRLFSVTTAFLAGPIAILACGRGLTSEYENRRTTAAGALLGIGFAVSAWFVLLGLRSPHTTTFIYLGALLAVVGGTSGLLGVAATLVPRSAQAVRPAVSRASGWAARRMNLGAVLAIAGALGVCVAVWVWELPQGPSDRDAVYLAAAQLVPPVVVLLFGLALLPGHPNRWGISSGAWLGIGLSLGVTYLFVGVVYRFSLGSLTECLSYFVVAAGGRSVMLGTEAIRVAEEAERVRAERLRPKYHSHSFALVGDVETHLRNLHGQAAPPPSMGASEELHARLHAQATKVP